MVQLNMSLVPDKSKAAFEQVQDELTRLEQKDADILIVLDELQLGYNSMRRYEPIMQQLSENGLKVSAEMLKKAAEDFAESPMFDQIMTEIIAEALKTSVKEVEDMFEEVKGKIGAVALENNALKMRVDTMSGRVDTVVTQVAEHDKSILGLQATTEGLATQVAVLEKRPAGGSSDDFNGRAFVVTMAMSWAIFGFVLYVGSGWKISIPQIGVAFALAFLMGLFAGYFYRESKATNADKLPLKARLTGTPVAVTPQAATPPAPTTTIPPAPADTAAVPAGSPSNN